MNVVSAPNQSMLPQAVRNIVESVNCVSRIVLKSCEGAERTITGIDEISTLMLSQQQQRLLKQLEAV